MPIDHRQRRLVDGDHRQRPRVVGVGERLADRDLGQPGHGDDLARPGLVGVDPVERLGDVELGHASPARWCRRRGTRRSAGPCGSCPWRTRQSARRPDVGGGVEVGDLRLERVVRARTRAPGCARAAGRTAARGRCPRRPPRARPSRPSRSCRRSGTRSAPRRRRGRGTARRPRRPPRRCARRAGRPCSPRGSPAAAPRAPCAARSGSGAAGPRRRRPAAARRRPSSARARPRRRSRRGRACRRC